MLDQPEIYRKPSSMDGILADLEKYGVSRNSGFVPEKGSKRLPQPFQPWEDLNACLSAKLTCGVLLNEIVSLPTFPIEELHEEYQWQRAYIVLAFITHAVVHGHHQTTVPAVLAEPFLIVCDHLGIRPVLSYVGLCLYNWSRGDNQKLLHGLTSEMSFTGTPDEAAFYLVPVLVELAGGQLPDLLIQTLIAAARGDWDVVTHNLDECLKAIKAMSEVLGELNLCRPQVFYERIRPYIAGLDVAFERIDNIPLQVKQAGGSAVQSSLFMFLDHVLGVSHDLALLSESRNYMPGGHRRFLEEIATQPSLLDLIREQVAASTARSRLVECRDELQKWRSKHMAIVTRYVVLPAQSAARAKGKDTLQITGTAGSSPLPFLKQVKSDTAL